MAAIAVIAGASGGGALLCCVVLFTIACCTYCCVKSFKSRRQRRVSEHFPKFRVIDAPNPSFTEEDETPSPHTNIPNGCETKEDRGESIDKRLPAKLPDGAMKELSSSEYSYALPNEVRPITYSKRSSDYSYAETRDSFHSNQPKLSAEGEKKVQNVSRPRSESPADYTAPVASEGVGSDHSQPLSPSSPISLSHAGLAEDYTSPLPSDGPSPMSSPTVPAESIYMTPATNEESLYMQIKSLNVRHINRNSIEIHEKLGSGNFGCVMKCVYRESSSSERDVAAKTLKLESSTTDEIKFLQEAAIMGQFYHPNVVELLGVVTKGNPLMIVLELMPKGDLRNYLVQIKPDAESDLPKRLLEFCRQIAKGMVYLSNKCFIHRDLAARNILLDNGHTCKIGDFGMARDLMDEDYYISHGGKMPVKWTAPEALNYRKYTTASDVWSFGCLLFEIWSLGHKPFERRTNKETLRLIEEGTRLHPPPGCTRSMYHLMIECWHPEHSSRPSFTSILSCLTDNGEQLLEWSDEDRQQCSSAAATALGGNLSESENLYLDLQLTYIH